MFESDAPTDMSKVIQGPTTYYYADIKCSVMLKMEYFYDIS